MKALILTLFLTSLVTANVWAQTTESIAVFQPLPTQKTKKSKKQKYGGDVIDVAMVDFDYKIDIRTFGFSLNLIVPNRELVFDSGKEYFHSYLNIFVRVTKKGEKSAGAFEEKLLIKFNKGEEEAAMKRATTYTKLFELSPGIYKIDILVRDIKSGNSGIRSTGFEIPK